MKRLTFKRAHNPDKLMAELIALPFLQPIDREGLGKVMVFTLSGGKGNTIEIDAPDDADEQAIGAVITAHDATPTERPKDRKKRAKDALAAIDGSKLTAETRKLLAVLAELVDD